MTNWLDDDDQPKQWSLADVYGDLGVKQDVAKRLDVKEDRVTQWIKRRERINCPLPVRTFGTVTIYSLQEWEDWYKRWLAKRKPGTKWSTEAMKNNDGRPEYDHDWVQPE